MGVNDGFLEIYIFNVNYTPFKVVINFSKEMCTVYNSKGRIIMRKEKMSQLEMHYLRKKIIKYLNEKKILKLQFFKGGLII